MGQRLWQFWLPRSPLWPQTIRQELVLYELDMIAKPDFDKCQATEVGEPARELVTKRYMVTVTEIDNGNNN